MDVDFFFSPLMPFKLSHSDFFVLATKNVFLHVHFLFSLDAIFADKASNGFSLRSSCKEQLQILQYFSK